MSNYADQSGEFLAKIDAEIRTYQDKKSAAVRTLNTRLQEVKDESETKKNNIRKKVHQEYDQLKSKCASRIISDFRYCFDTVELSQDLLAEAQDRIYLSEILVGRKKVDSEILGKTILPVFIPWQHTHPLAPGNIQIIYRTQDQIEALKTGKNLLIRMFTAFSPGSVHLTFIDPAKTHAAGFFVKSLENSPTLYYNKVKTEHDEIRSHLLLLNQKMDQIQKDIPVNASSILEFNIEKKNIKHPYEVICIYDCQVLGSSYKDLLIPLISNGNKHGIYVILFNDRPDEKNTQLAELLRPEKFINLHIGPDKTAHSLSYFDPESQTNHKNSFHGLDDLSLLPDGERTAIKAPNLLAINNCETSFLDSYFQAINELVKQNLKKNKIEIDFEKYESKPFERTTAGFSVPIAQLGSKEFDFQLDDGSNVHTFIIGKTGSGKSILLHNILTTAILKYHPDTLQLYLIDFKKGGVEFNKYTKVKIPHVKTALLDDCDRQIVLEILQDIGREMQRRGKLLQDAEIEKISEYNKSQEERNQLPLIILAIDECHLLFSSRLDETQKEINKITERIATEGRNQGIHMILATQTLADSNVPEKVLKNMSHRFFLGGDYSDAVKLIQEVDLRHIGMITEVGQCLYKKEKESIELIRFFYVEREKNEEVLRKLSERTTDITCQPLVFEGEHKPGIYGVLDNMLKNQSMLLGESISVRTGRPPVFIPIHARQAGNNLLIVGNKSDLEPKDAEKNAIRIILSTFLSLNTHYQKSGKDYQVIVINRLNGEENPDVQLITNFMDHDNYQFVPPRKKSTENVLLELNRRIDEEVEDAPDVYLYIIGQQLFRELRNNEDIEDPSQPPAPDPNTGGFSGFPYQSTGKKQLTYRSALHRILDRGGDYGIHVVIQVDKESNLLFEGAMSARKFFSYYALLAMPDMDAERLTRQNDIKTETLSSEPDRARAYFYDDLTSRYGIFVPYYFEDHKEKLEEYIK